MARNLRLQDGRQVVLVRGTKTQTLNVCTPDNRAGAYERTYRFPMTEYLDPTYVAELADPGALRGWASSHNGVEEDPGGRRERAVLPLVNVDCEEDWFSSATKAVETVLDAAVTVFLQHPYRHRVEHSLHAELYRRLKDQEVLQGQFPLRTGEVTQLVHKEWPETYADPRPGASGKRGAFDLAVLSPRQLAAASLEQFRQGRIAACIVIEVGLDYSLKHLEDDGAKMRNSRVQAPYLLHLSRVRDQQAQAIEAYVTTPPADLRVAYVHHNPIGTTRYKKLSDNEVHPA